MPSFNLLRFVSGKLIEESVGSIPSGGTLAQVLTKNSSTDYDSAWTEQSSMTKMKLSETRVSTTVASDSSLSGFNLTSGSTYLAELYLKIQFGSTSDFIFGLVSSGTASLSGEYVAHSFITADAQPVDLICDNITAVNTDYTIPGLPSETVVARVNALLTGIPTAATFSLRWAPSDSSGVTLLNSSMRVTRTS
jgi:hypothetical protein